MFLEGGRRAISFTPSEEVMAQKKTGAVLGKAPSERIHLGKGVNVTLKKYKGRRHSSQKRGSLPPDLRGESGIGSPLGGEGGRFRRRGGDLLFRFSRRQSARDRVGETPGRDGSTAKEWEPKGDNMGKGKKKGRECNFPLLEKWNGVRVIQRGKNRLPFASVGKEGKNGTEGKSSPSPSSFLGKTDWRLRRERGPGPVQPVAITGKVKKVGGGKREVACFVGRKGEPVSLWMWGKEKIIHWGGWEKKKQKGRIPHHQKEVDPVRGKGAVMLNAFLRG